jgi:hypothetical protein
VSFSCLVNHLPNSVRPVMLVLEKSGFDSAKLCACVGSQNVFCVSVCVCTCVRGLASQNVSTIGEIKFMF